MIARKVSVTVLAALLVAAFSALAAAAPRYYSSVYASPIIRYSTYQDAGACPLWETANLGGNYYNTPDPFMIVQAPDGASYHAHDNVGGNNAYVWKCSNTAGYWNVIILANYQANFGTLDLYMNYNLTSVQNYFFGGTVIDSGVPAGHTYSYETVEPPSDGADTIMYLFDSNWNQKAFDDDHGLGLQSRFTASASSGDRIVLATYAAGEYGYARLLINDCPGDPDADIESCQDANGNNLDSDGDYLSDALEEEIGTSTTSRDTDGDGLYDYYEVYGRRLDMQRYDFTHQNHEALPFEGADPLHRDVFLEFDYQNTVPTADYHDESYVSDAAGYFSGLAMPDGSTGISLHADIGETCSNATLCGDWGGTSYSSSAAGGTAIDYSYIKNNDTMAPVRRGLFHYVYTSEDCPGRQGEGWTPGSSLWVCDTWPAETLAHELGHNLGLHHYGSSPQGAGMNWKPAYPSLMNYACAWGPCWTGAAQFSNGSGRTLDELNLDETSTTGVDLTLVTNSEFQFNQLGGGIDWNRDGRTSQTPVRADLSPLEQIQYVKNWPANADVSQVSATELLGGPGLASHTSGGTTHLYAFGAYDDSGVTRLGYTWSGSSPAWGDMTPLSVSFTPTDIGETAAATAGGKILVVHPLFTNGHLGYAVFDTSTKTVTSSGAIPVTWPSGATARQASVANIGGDIAVVFRDNSSSSSVAVWQATWDPSTDTWSAWQQLTDTSGNPIKSQLTPGIAEGPDGAEYLVTVDNASLHTWRGAPGADFTDLFGQNSPNWEGAVPSNGSRPRINLVFLPYLHADGSAFGDGSAYPVVYYAFNGHWYRWRSSVGYVDTSGPHLSVNFDSNSQENVGAAPADSESVAVAATPSGDADLVFAQSPTGAGPLWLVPHASGIATDFAGQDTDNNDARTMECNMCGVWKIASDAQASACQSYEPAFGCSLMSAPTEVSCYL